jgi:hypothetical protein
MAATEFSLFRIKFIKPSQKDLFHDEEKTPGDYFKAALEDRPSLKVREPFIWHIGNLKDFSPTQGYFAVGRTSKKTVDLYDEKTKNFIEIDHNESPYAHCLFDSKIGILVISKNNILSQKTEMIAETIEKLLSLNSEIFKNEIRVEIVPIPDPEGFIRQLSNAFLVTRFTASFGGPNPFDADEFFQRPMSVYLNSARGEEGTTTIKGKSLDNETLVEVAKSTAATGNQASAKIKRDENSKPETIHLKGDPVKRKIDLDGYSLNEVLDKFLEIYYTIRGKCL